MSSANAGIYPVFMYINSGIFVADSFAEEIHTPAEI